MNLDFIPGLLKPYLPTITNTYLPKVSAYIAEQLKEEDLHLKENEKETVCMLSRDGDDVVLRVVRLDGNAKVVRCTPPIPLTDFLAGLITNAMNK